MFNFEDEDFDPFCPNCKKLIDGCYGGCLSCDEMGDDEQPEDQSYYIRSVEIIEPAVNAPEIGLFLSPLYVTEIVFKHDGSQAHTPKS